MRSGSKTAIGAAALVVALVGGAMAFASPGTQNHRPRLQSRVLRLGVAFSPLNVVDVDENGLSAGDVITAHDRVFNRQTLKRVGHEGVACTIESIDPVEAVCQIIFKLPGGTITGQFFSLPGGALKRGAVTGGTGIYRLARGSFTLQESGQDENIRGNRLTIKVTDVLRGRRAS